MVDGGGWSWAAGGWVVVGGGGGAPLSEVALW